MISFDEIKKESIIDVAKKMLIAAKTAPKGRGLDNLYLGLLTDKTQREAVAQKMEELAAQHEVSIFKRDANHIRQAEVVVVLAARISPTGLKVCGYCGFENCAAKPQEVPCIFNLTDLGMAACSAAAVAMDHRVDNRILYTAGKGIKELKLLPEEFKVIYTIPLEACAKNPFFDRPPVS